MKSVKNLLLTGLIALAAITMGCPTGDDGSSSTPTGIQLPDIDEPTTGQASISGSDIPLPDYTGGDIASTTNNYEGYTFQVTDGKLSFTLGTPTYFPGVDPDIFGKTSPGYEVTLSPDSTQATLFEGFDSYADDIFILRYKAKTDDPTYELRCQIFYIYVNQDCTYSREAKTTGNDTYDAFTLELKTGWNLVQKNTSARQGQGNYSWSIATKDVPWSVYSSNN